MDIKIIPSIIGGTVLAPPSKSYTHRAVILAALAKGKSILKNILISEDTLATINALKALGVRMKLYGNTLEIEGTGGQFHIEKPVNIFCNNSGTTARLITSVSVLTDGNVVIDGNIRLRERPFSDLVNALRSQGIIITGYNNKNNLPVTVQGGLLKGRIIKISGKLSSQFISSLLLVSPFAQKDTIIEIKDLISAPYIDLTVDLMKKFGVDVRCVDNRYLIKNNQKYLANDYKIEGDYSSASYFFAAAAITGSEITVGNLKHNSKQGDKFFLKLLEKMGCKIKCLDNQMTVSGNNLKNITVDLGSFPDIVPALSVVAACAHGISVISNISHLRAKETDRITALANELRKMKIKVGTSFDSLIIHGGQLQGANISTYNDHRIAMSFAVAGLATNGETVIKNAQTVNKSYPNFWKDLKKIGSNLIAHDS